MKEFVIIETTYPNLNEAKNLAKILFDQKLAACIHFIPIESIYFWSDKLQNDAEILLRIKTGNSLYQEVEQVIKKHHSYENPEIVVIQIDQGSKSYLDWVEKSIKTSGK